jgi:hypothetical protein
MVGCGEWKNGDKTTMQRILRRKRGGRKRARLGK